MPEPYRDEFEGSQLQRWFDAQRGPRLEKHHVMTAADIGLDTVHRPLYPFCREFLITGTSTVNGVTRFNYVENTLWR